MLRVLLWASIIAALNLPLKNSCPLAFLPAFMLEEWLSLAVKKSKKMKQIAHDFPLFFLSWKIHTDDDLRAK